MSGIVLPWLVVRRHGVTAFIRTMGERHPELKRLVLWDDMLRMANREGIFVRTVALPSAVKARLVRCGERAFIQINANLRREEQTIHGMHELVHFWRDDPGVACYYSDEISQATNEDFADIVAWAVTSPARVHVPGLREEDF